MKKVYWMTKLVLIALIVARVNVSRAGATRLNEAAGQTPQEISSVLFQKAEKELAAAKAESADILAQKTFAEGLKKFLEAEKLFANGEKLADIFTALNAAIVSFQKAGDTAKLAKVAFASAWNARGDAQKAEAPQWAMATWQKAEEKLLQAARRLEEGDLNGARKKTWNNWPTLQKRTALKSTL